MISLAAIRVVVLDVDGVLTDGRLHYGGDGEQLKVFDVKDGLGVRRLIDAGIEVAVISGRDSAALRARLGDLGVQRVFAGVSDKANALTSVLSDVGVEAEYALAVGDDLPDLAMFGTVGIAVSVADGHPRVKAAAHWVTTAAGGRGAVREISDAILRARCEKRADFHVVIPSRYGSSRLPGKPLRLIAGRPMIAHVWDRALESGAADVVVATDDQRIVESVNDFGGEALMTSADHQSGTDRIAEVAAARGWQGHDIVVNLQGDEPAMPAENITAVAEALALRPWFSIATMATPIEDVATLFDPNAVKVVLDNAGAARYFSRAPIPWHRDSFGRGVPEDLPEGGEFLRHLGLYAYRVADLHMLAASAPSSLERTESLEQLRALARGLDIHVTIVEKAPPDGVDTENDLERIERFMASGADAAGCLSDA